jgi:hypothetical protein
MNAFDSVNAHSSWVVRQPDLIFLTIPRIFQQSKLNLNIPEKDEKWLARRAFDFKSQVMLDTCIYSSQLLDDMYP